MTRFTLFAALIAAPLAACAPPKDQPLPGAEDIAQNPATALDAVDLNELMLTVSDPDDGVAYFQRASAESPERLDLKRGLALSLARAGRHAEAVRAFEQVALTEAADDILRVEYANSLARLGRWNDAEIQMSLVSPALETARRFQMVAMLADQRSEWSRADLAYDRARLLTPNPAQVLNNWGVSHMARGDFNGARRYFEEAIAFNPGLFAAKNNLAVAGALNGNYALPLVSVDEEERATLLHNIAVIALRRGDADQAKGLLAMAVAAHPRHYAAAAEKLAALEAQVAN